MLSTARQREIASCRWTIHVPSGACDVWPIGRAALIRLGSARTALPVADASEVWASCPAVADDLIRAGLDPSRVRVLAPSIALPAHGTGGAGILAILPTHDPRAAETVFDALRSVAAATPVPMMAVSRLMLPVRPVLMMATGTSWFTPTMVW